MTAKTDTTEVSAPRAGRAAQSYVQGSHAARVKAEQDERRVELLALNDVLCAQRDALDGQIADIGQALMLLSPGAAAGNVVSMAAE